MFLTTAHYIVYVLVYIIYGGSVIRLLSTQCSIGSKCVIVWVARRNGVLFGVQYVFGVKLRGGLPRNSSRRCRHWISTPTRKLFPFPAFLFVCNFLWAKYFATHFVRLSLDKAAFSFAHSLFLGQLAIIFGFLKREKVGKTKARLCSSVIVFNFITLFVQINLRPIWSKKNKV